MWYFLTGWRRRRSAWHGSGLRKTRSAIALVFILTHGLATVTWAQVAATGQALSLDAALRDAEAQTLTMVHHAAEAGAARELAVAARQLPDPVLSLSLQNLVVSGPNQWSPAREPMTMSTVGVSQTFTREAKRKARAERFEQEARLADIRVLSRLVQLRLDTALAWLERFYREQQLVLLQQQRNENVVLVAATEAAFKTGNGQQTEVFMARSELARIDDRIREAEAHVANAVTALARWTGTSATRQLGTAPAIDTLSWQNEGLEPELAQVPALQELAQQEALAQAEVALAQQNRHEDWSVQLMLSRRDPDFGNLVSVGVSIPLQLGRANKQEREVAAKLALAAAVRSEQTELLRSYQAQTRSWLESWQSNLERLHQYDATLIPLALARSEAARSAYQGKLTPLTTVLDARRAEIDTRLDRLNLELATAVLRAQLEFLLPPMDASLSVLATETYQPEPRDE